MTQSDLKKLKKAVGEAVRRGIEYDDWMAECVLRLSNKGGDPIDRLAATAACSLMWRDACEEEGIKI